MTSVLTLTMRYTIGSTNSVSMVDEIIPPIFASTFLSKTASSSLTLWLLEHQVIGYSPIGAPQQNALDTDHQVATNQSDGATTKAKKRQFSAELLHDDAERDAQQVNDGGAAKES